MPYAIDVLLSLTLPFLFCGFVGGIFAMFMRHAVSPATIERVQRKNAAKDFLHPEHQRDAVKPHHWESHLDAEIQRLKRKSLGQ
jgi:hypothetical protein